MKKLIYTLLEASTLLLLCSCQSNEIQTTKYKLTLNPNGGTVEYDTLLVDEDESLKLPTPTKEGKTFLGWYTGYELLSDEISTIKKMDKDITLYARWDSYDINYLDNEGNELFHITRLDGSIPYNYGLDFDINVSTIHQDLDFKLKNKLDDTLIKVNINAISKDMNYTVPILYNDNYFNDKSNTFSKNLSLYSYGLSVATDSTDNLNHVFNESGYNDISYFGYETKEDVSYAIAKKKISGMNYVIVALRGFYYTNEWVGNFKIGQTGNHNGFVDETNIVYNDLENKLQDLDLSHTKLLITGYSKAGSISGLLTEKLIDNHILDKDNIYTYSFLAPNYSNHTSSDYPIYNFKNDSDLLSNLIPTIYNLYTLGNDYSSNSYLKMDKLYAIFDLSLDYPKFKKTSNYSNSSELMAYLLNTLLSYKEEGKDISTRENYSTNYQDSIVYLLTKCFNLSYLDVIELATKISKKAITDSDTLNNIDSILEIITEYFDEHNINYNLDTLKNSILKLLDLIQGPMGRLKSELIFNSSNLNHILMMHYPLSTYLLLQEYIKE